MIGMGTRDQDLIRLIVSRCEKDLGAIKQDFEFLYKKSLATVVAVSDQMMNASKISLIESIKQHSWFYRVRHLVYEMLITKNPSWL